MKEKQDGVMKILPNDLQAEQSVIGACLIDPEAVIIANEILAKEDFYREDNKIIFSCICSLYGKNEPIDIITIKNELSSIGKFESVGGIEYIAKLPEMVPTTANVEKYINIIKDKAIKRNLINMSNEISKLSFDPTVETELLTETAERKIFEITQKKNIKGVSNLKELLVESLSKLEDVYNNGKKKGISTGFGDIDRRMGGLKGSELIILAARPGMRKISVCTKYSHKCGKKRKSSCTYI